MPAPSNPFASRFLRPGARPFLWATGGSTAALVEQLAQSRWRAQVVGPHGAGKSSLLADLVPACRSRGREPIVAHLHQGDRRLPTDLLGQPWHRKTLVVIDGYEQLGAVARGRLITRVWRSQCGLLLSCHRPQWYVPILYACEPSLDVLRRVVDQMTTGLDWQVDEPRLADIYRRCQGNLRECLFALYDEFASSQPP